MHDIYSVHGMESPYRLDEYLPNKSLFDIRSVLFVLAYFQENIALLCVVHDDAQEFTTVNKSLSVLHHVRMLN